ncbi:hypothetical protein MASR2M36_38030 [Providencia sp.]
MSTIQLALSVHSLMEKLNIDHIVGCAADINAIIHYGTNYANAFWNSQAIFFGDGDGINFGPFYNDIDIIAHELSHGYISSKANFEYINQSGALNESSPTFSHHGKTICTKRNCR